MYANTSSYLGGASNNTRSGRPQYTQASFAQPSNGPPPQQAYSASIQQEFAGYPSQTQYQQSQATGFPGQNLQNYQQLLQEQPPPQQPQHQFSTIPPRNGSVPIQLSQPTGMTSAQMADSFKPTPATSSSSTPMANATSTRIPNIRLSFITALDQAKFEQLFKSAAGTSQSLSGDQARDLLLRSKLPGDVLSQIWTLSDTTKSGQLLFPEFALAMYLCNLKIVGKSLPQILPEKINNEVSSMVDIISFGVPDDRVAVQIPSNAPNFSSPPMQQPQPQQPANSQLLAQLVAQPTAFQAPVTFQPQPTGLNVQPTGFMGSPQPIGYSGPRPSMPPMPMGLSSGQGAIAPLNAQPTGRPGQWGLVNAPSSGLPNIDALQQRMMPQPGREGGFTTVGLSGNATVPWAVTKDEKKIYDNLFKTWDGFGKGFITGNQAIEIFEQSGLEKSDLERIWTLSDPNNKGRLDLDEFAVAMHLIYRKLNGYPVPARLPPELVPPSTRHLTDTIGTVKSMLSRDAEERKSSGSFLQPQKTGVSYLKNHSFRNMNGTSHSTRKDATIFKNDDDDVGYKSSARRRVGGGGRSPSPAQSGSPASELADEMSIEQLRKRIREKQVILDAVDFQEEDEADQDKAMDRKDRRDADDLYSRIRKLQDNIDTHPDAFYRSTDSSAEKRTLIRQLQGLTDRLPELASQVRKAERSISDARLELFRLKDAKTHPTSHLMITGTGPGGSITESDRLKARAKAMMQQRSAALTGKSIPSEDDDTAATARRLEDEDSKVRSERENNERMVREVEESVKTYSQGVEDSIKGIGEDSASEHEQRRWEEGLGVEDDVKEFILDLQRSSRSARIRREDNDRTPTAREKISGSTIALESQSPAHKPSTDNSFPGNSSKSHTASRTNAPSSSYSSYKTAEERAAFIKQQAEQRMAERLAALGLKVPMKSVNNVQKEKEDRQRQAEEEDQRRERERQQRLENEQIAPPTIISTSSKKPPPPPSRRGRSDSSQSNKRGDTENKRGSQSINQNALREQQQSQEAQTKSIEDEERRQEEDLRKEREESEARRIALEEQVKQGKIKKDEERRRKQAASRATKEKEDRLAAQRAEVEAARERERQLQLQLDAMNEDSSDDEIHGQTPIVSQELSKSITTASTEETQQLNEMTTSIPPVKSTTQAMSPSVASPPAISLDAASNNPFFKKMQSNDPPLSPSAPTAELSSSTNPFHRISTQDSSKVVAPPPSRTIRGRGTDDDDWSAVDSSATDDDEEDRPDSTGAGSAKQLASILFGTMGPPRPVSSMSNEVKSSSSSAHVAVPAASPYTAPPPPPLPGFNTAAAQPPAPPPLPPASPGMPSAPPPPPPMPSSGGGGLPDKSALLGQIQAGKGLKKVETKDRSTSSSAGRVL